MGICQGKEKNTRYYERSQNINKNQYPDEEPPQYSNILSELLQKNYSDEDIKNVLEEFQNIRGQNVVYKTSKDEEVHSDFLQGYEWTINPYYDTSITIIEEVPPALPPKKSQMSQLSNENINDLIKDPIYDNARLKKHAINISKYNDFTESVYEPIYKNYGSVVRKKLIPSSQKSVPSTDSFA